jgi:hypothetical protein
MTRKPRPLKDWLQLSCQYKGVMAGRSRRFGKTYFLMRNVVIRPWSLPVEQARTVDHLWLYFGEDDMDSPVSQTRNQDSYRMLDDYDGCGEIIQYHRSDGSVDYGIKAYLGLIPHESYKVVLQARDGSEMLGKVQHLHNMFLKGRVLAPLGFDLTRAFAEIDEMIHYCERQVVVDRKYEEIRRRSCGPKPRGLGLKLPAQTKPAPAGFAR